MASVAGPSGKTGDFATLFSLFVCEIAGLAVHTFFDKLKRNDSLRSRDVIRLSIRMFLNFHSSTHFECAPDGFARSCCSRKCVFVHRPSGSNYTEYARSLQLANDVHAVNLVRQRRVLRTPPLHLKLKCRVPQVRH